MVEWLVVFALVVTRVSAFVLILPVFGWPAIPVLLRVASVVMLSVFYTAYSPVAIVAGQVSGATLVWLMVNEATYGLALGVVAYVVFSIVRCAGVIIEEQMGFNMAEIFDPLTGESSQPVSSLLEMVFILLILATNGHHLFLQVVARSYEAFPVGTVPHTEVLTLAVVKATSVMLVASLRLAAPLFGAFFVLVVVLAIMARIVPEMNILYVSMPVRIALGLAMTIAFLPLIQDFLSEYARWMGQLLPL